MLLPGFVNAHCHLDYTGMEGELPPTREFARWIRSIVRLKEGWSAAQYRQSWIEGARRLERSGVTTVVDIEAVWELLPEAWRSTSLRVLSCLELMDIASPGQAARLVGQALERSTRLEGSGPARCGLSPHAPYTVSDELYRQAAGAARSQSRILATHGAESEDEDRLCRQESGPFRRWMEEMGSGWPPGRGAAVELLDRTGCLGRRTLLAHANYLAPGEEEILARSRTTVVHCPRSHRYFGHRAFDWRKLEKAGVSLALGTDSAASTRDPCGPALDFFGELSCLAGSPDAPDPGRILRWATSGPGEALGNGTGRIEAGCPADLIAVESGCAPGQAAEAVVHHRGGLAASMIGGKWIHEPCRG